MDTTILPPLANLEGTSNSLRVEGLNALGTLEQKIMGIFWSEAWRKLTGGDVYAIIAREQIHARERGVEVESYAYTTIKTTMTRLVQKGALSVEQTAGNSAAVYQATCTQQEFIDRAVTRVVEQMVALSPEAARQAMARVQS